METSEPDSLDVALGQAVRLARRRREMSQADLGGAVGVSFQQIQKYERGTNRISFSMLAHMAQALGVPISELVGAVDQLAGGEASTPLVPTEGTAVLEALSQIKSAGVRRAIVEFARELARQA